MIFLYLHRKYIVAYCVHAKKMAFEHGSLVQIKAYNFEDLVNVSTEVLFFTDSCSVALLWGLDHSLQPGRWSTVNFHGIV